jgi:hypothetical protein
MPGLGRAGSTSARIKGGGLIESSASICGLSWSAISKIYKR